MKNFWPSRSRAKGFSIENLARKYREKISIVSSDKNSNQDIDDRNLKYIRKDHEKNKDSTTLHLSLKREHWANRDFSEYREVA